MGVFGEEGGGGGIGGGLRLCTGRAPPLRHGDMRVLVVLVLVLVVIIVRVLLLHHHLLLLRVTTVGGSINKLKLVFTFTGRRRGRQGARHCLLARARRPGAGPVLCVLLLLLWAAASGPSVVLLGHLGRRVGRLAEGARHGRSLRPGAGGGHGLALESLFHLLYAGLKGLEL